MVKDETERGERPVTARQRVMKKREKQNRSRRRDSCRVGQIFDARHKFRAGSEARYALVIAFLVFERLLAGGNAGGSAATSD